MVSPREVPVLQKMEIADLIDAAIRLYRHNFSVLLQIVLKPVAMIGIVLIYYDLRIRKEGFDLVMMAQELYQQAPQRRPAPAAPPLFSAGVALPPRPREDTDGTANLPPPPPQAGIDNGQAG